MEILYFFLSILSIIGSILSIILFFKFFFKIWGATNDIAEMKKMMQNWLHYNQYSDSSKLDEKGININVGDIIIRNNDGKEYEVKEVRDDCIVIDLGGLSGTRTLDKTQFTIKE